MTFRWPGTLLVNGAQAGTLRIAWPEGTPEDAVPDWIVVAAEARVSFPRGWEPGHGLHQTALVEEGWDPEEVSAAELTAAWARHLMAGLAEWQRPGGFRRLAERFLARLDRLNLTRCELGPDGAAFLARPATAKVPGELDLSYNGIGDEGAKTLARWPWLTGVTVLSLRSNRIGDAGAVALAGSPHLASLRELSLRHNRIRAAGRAYLFVDLAVAMLAGFGLDTLLRGRTGWTARERASLKWGLIALGLALGAMVLVAIPLMASRILSVNEPGNRPVIALDNLNLLALWLALGLGVGVGVGVGVAEGSGGKVTVGRALGTGSRVSAQATMNAAGVSAPSWSMRRREISTREEANRPRARPPAAPTAALMV